MIFQKGGENIFFTRKYTLPFAIYCTIEHKEENGGVFGSWGRGMVDSISLTI